MVRLVSVELFRRYYHSLRRDRAFFRITAREFERFPWHFNAIEWAFDRYASSLTEAYRPGEVASAVALAYFLTVKNVLPRPPSEKILDKIVSGWYNPERQDDEQNFLGFWTETKKGFLWQGTEISLYAENPLLVDAIEAFVREDSSLVDHDRQLIYFAIALFFRQLLINELALGKEINELIASASPVEPV